MTAVCSEDMRILETNAAFRRCFPLCDSHLSKVIGTRLDTNGKGRCEPGQRECRLTAADGRLFWSRITVTAVFFPPEGRHWVIQIEDISRARAREDQLAYRESIFRFAVAASGEGVWDYDARTGHRFYSEEWKKLRGLPIDADDSTLHEGWESRLHPDDYQRMMDANSKVDSTEDSFSHEYRERHAEGHYIWIVSRGKVLARNQDGRILRVTGIDIDITDLKKKEELRRLEVEERHRTHLAELERAQRQTEAAQQIAERMSLLDPLTELANRRAFSERLGTLIGEGKTAPVPFGVLLIDLDRFKPVNDTYGHSAGDHVIRVVSDRLREMASATDLVARLGGDEFGIIAVGSGTGPVVEYCADLAERLRQSISSEIRFNDTPLEIGASIGISLHPDHGKTRSELLRHADLALYHVKERRLGTFEIFSNDIDRAQHERAELETRIRVAVKEDAFEPYFQPIVDLCSHRIVSFEVLARWQHPTRGQVPPSEFFPLIEQFGLQREFGHKVLTRALAVARHWPEEIALNFNISTAGFGDPAMPGRVLASLADTGFDPRRFRIEVSETSLIDKLDVAAENIGKLRRAGIGIALDDFGVGYSWLSYLRRLKIDALKLDRSFVIPMEENEAANKIVHSVSALGSQFDLTLVAEGIETVEILNAVRAAGYDYGQGFLYSRAVPAKDVTALIEAARDGWPIPVAD